MVDLNDAAWKAGEWRFVFEPGDGSFEYVRKNKDGTFTTTSEEPPEFKKDQTITALRAALEEVAEGKGRYSMDPLEHCGNTVDDMKDIAITALKEN